LKLVKTFTETLQMMKEAEQKKRPEGWRKKTWMLHRNNAPAHTSLLVSEFLLKQDITVAPNTLLSSFGSCRLIF
jgi:hypothetical protein